MWVLSDSEKTLQIDQAGTVKHWRTGLLTGNKVLGGCPCLIWVLVPGMLGLLRTWFGSPPRRMRPFAIATGWQGNFLAEIGVSEPGLEGCVGTDPWWPPQAHAEGLQNLSINYSFKINLSVKSVKAEKVMISHKTLIQLIKSQWNQLLNGSAYWADCSGLHSTEPTAVVGALKWGLPAPERVAAAVGAVGWPTVSSARSLPPSMEPCLLLRCHL